MYNPHKRKNEYDGNGWGLFSATFPHPFRTFSSKNLDIGCFGSSFVSRRMPDIKRGAAIQKGQPGHKSKPVNHAKRAMLMKRPPPSFEEHLHAMETKRESTRRFVEEWRDSIEPPVEIDMEMTAWLGEDIPLVESDITNNATPPHPSQRCGIHHCAQHH